MENVKEISLNDMVFTENLDQNFNGSANLSKSTDTTVSQDVNESSENQNTEMEETSMLEKNIVDDNKEDAVQKQKESSVYSKSLEYIEPLEGDDSRDSEKLIIDETHQNENDKFMSIDNKQQIEQKKHNMCDAIHDEIASVNEIFNDVATESIELNKNTTNASFTSTITAITNEINTICDGKSTNICGEDALEKVDVVINLDKSNESINESNKIILSEESGEINANKKEREDPEIYYNKECINHECLQEHKQFVKASLSVLNYYQVNCKPNRAQYVCINCCNIAMDMYEEFCGLLCDKQPLVLANIPKSRQEYVEIIDSSDEEEKPSPPDLDNDQSSSHSEKQTFSKDVLNLIDTELINSIQNVFNYVDIQKQLTWAQTILSYRQKNLQINSELMNKEIHNLKKTSDRMFARLYSYPKNIRHLQPLDINCDEIPRPSTTRIGLDPHSQAQLAESVPPTGDVERPPIQINGIYYGVKNNVISRWLPCRILEQAEIYLKNVRHYKIKYLKSQYQTFKTVPAKHLAYYEPPSYRLPIGTRVIAYFDASSLSRGKEKIGVQSAFYPGIIAEPLKPNNNFRYLIFYDDGYTQYVHHKDVRLVCHVSENVWEDIHPTSRDFIQKYITQYSINRPMVQAQKGQSMGTQSNGMWLRARVVDIDCSLVLMQFEGIRNHTEWIYRGSLRLLPVFKEYQKTLQKTTPGPVSRLPRRTEPFIRYTQDEDSSDQSISHRQQQIKQHQTGVRSVARKSFGRHENTASHMPVKTLNNSTIYVEDESKPKGKVIYYTAKRVLVPRKFRIHECDPSCLLDTTHNLSTYSPLSKPLLSGWERPIFKQHNSKKVICYRGPCGRLFRNMKELHYYLRLTECSLNVDNFDFTPETNCLAEYVTSSAIVQRKDISKGQEKMPIPLVNYYDNTLPPECRYSATVIPTEGVHINTDVEFLVGCDCEDDCSNKMQCSCWQLTLAGAKYGNPNTPLNEVGYQYKRLLEHVPTGIYECNARCKCKANCLNRVVQRPLQIKLQVFKTSNRGWGLRCVNDIPRGTFICIYAGHLLTEAKANEGGLDAGDEYFAELDYIEVAEQVKEGFESEVDISEPEDDFYMPEPEDDDEFRPSTSYMSRLKAKLHNQQYAEDDFQEREVISFNPNANMKEDSSIRKLFGKNEACYVMDAKITGNLGRYFNHSCSPNLFVQSVFVDTHDLRFPWVAFFASSHITAGTELTWNYNYEVGSVPGKVLYCQCGANNCRQRLL